MPSNPTVVQQLNAAEAEILVAVQKALYDVPGVVPAARTLSHVGEHALGWFALSGAGVLLDAPRRRQWLALGAAAFISHGASVVTKRVIRRRRPDDSRIRIGVGTPSRLSFPSSHSTSTTAAMVVLSRITGNPLPLVGVPIMMASRMVLGVHYPTDTLVGAAVGAACAGVTMQQERKMR